VSEQSLPLHIPFWRTAVAALVMVVVTNLTGWVFEAIIAALSAGAAPNVKLGFTLIMLPLAAVCGYWLSRQAADAALKRLYDGQLIFLLIVVGNFVAICMALFTPRIMLAGRLGAIFACCAGLAMAYRVFWCKPNP
jgi:hypothetical protein